MSRRLYGVDPNLPVPGRVENALRRASYALAHYFFYHQPFNPSAQATVEVLYSETQRAADMARLGWSQGFPSLAFYWAAETERLSDEVGKVAGVQQNAMYDWLVEQRAERQERRFAPWG